jgi:hypothetical protein
MSEWATYGYQHTAPPAGGYQPPPQQAPPQAAGGAGGGEWQANIATAAMAAAAGGGGQGALAQAAVGAIGGDAQAKLDQGASMVNRQPCGSVLLSSPPAAGWCSDKSPTGAMRAFAAETIRQP